MFCVLDKECEVLKLLCCFDWCLETASLTVCGVVEDETHPTRDCLSALAEKGEQERGRGSGPHKDHSPLGCHAFSAMTGTHPERSCC